MKSMKGKDYFGRRIYVDGKRKEYMKWVYGTQKYGKKWIESNG